MNSKINFNILYMLLTVFILSGCGSSTSDANSSPVISLNKTSLTFTGVEGGENPQSQSVTITNGGGGLLQVSAPADTERYSFTLTENSTNNLTLTVSVDITGLPAGVYTDAVMFGGDGLESRTISITLTITAPALAKWTVMLYSMADTNLEKDMMADIEEMLVVGSTDEVNVITQIDRHSASDHQHQPDTRAHDYEEGVGNISDWTTAKRFKVLQNNLVEIADLGEVNSGDPDALSDFLLWAKENYPAEKYVLIMSDHGGSWPGFGGDDSHQGDSLTLDEMTTALETAQLPLDVIGFDACFMANLEVAYELVPFADILIASEESEPGHGWDYTAILSSLSNNSTQTALQLGQVIADSYKTHAQTNKTSQITLSVIDLARIDELTAVLDLFASSINARLELEASTSDPVWSSLGQSRLRVEEYGKQGKDPDKNINVVDLKQLVNNIKTNANDISISNNADLVLSALEQAVLYKINDASKPNSSGISIYFPPKLTDNISARLNEYAGLTFALDSSWDETLSSYLGLALNDIIPPSIFQETNIVNATEGLVITAQFDPVDTAQVFAYVDNDEIILGEIVVPLEEDGTASVGFTDDWPALCGTDGCLYLPFIEIGVIDETTSLMGVDVLYTPANTTYGIDSILLFIYDWQTETETILGIVPDIENGVASKEMFLVDSGDKVQIYYEMVYDEDYLLSEPITVDVNGLTIEDFALTPGDYYIGFWGYDYAGNIAETEPVIVTVP